MRNLRFFIPVLMLAGMLFTAISCVDDSESESVKNLRDAKAGYLQAQTAYINAETYRYDTLTQIVIKIEEAKLALLEAETEAGIEEAKFRLAKIQIEAEYALAIAKAEAEADLIVAQQALEKAQRDAITSDNAYLAQLIGDYTSKIKEINALQTKIANKKLDIAVLEATLATGKKEETLYNASLVAALENDKKNKEVELTNAQKQLAALEILEKSGVSVDKEIENATTALNTTAGKKTTAYLDMKLKYNTYTRLLAEYNSVEPAKQVWLKDGLDKAQKTYLDAQEAYGLLETQYNIESAYLDGLKEVYNEQKNVSDLIAAQNIAIAEIKAEIAEIEDDIANKDADLPTQTAKMERKIVDEKAELSVLETELELRKKEETALKAQIAAL